MIKHTRKDCYNTFEAAVKLIVGKVKAARTVITVAFHLKPINIDRLVDET
jgi:hypothetical protein